MDKTGTLTKGVFEVQKVEAINIDKEELIKLTAAIESKSTHPIAIAIEKFAGDILKGVEIKDVEEIAGRGLKGIVNGKTVLAGNSKLLDKFDVKYDHAIKEIDESIVIIAVKDVYSGYFIVADEIKEDALQTITGLHQMGIKTVMLSGDKQSAVDKVAQFLNIDNAYGDLLPEHKVAKVQELKDQCKRIAFTGDGVNDAPVIALADVGIAMGGLGSDATIETADVVIQNDQPSKIISAIKIGKLTKNIVWQNIALAIGVKALVLTLGAAGIATLWEAVIADVGVALLAILNAVRIQRMEV
jgi:Cd2+/Zn2+-exporting ATPase